MSATSKMPKVSKVSKQAYVRTKPHLNIGTKGHLVLGKSTHTAAITNEL